VEETMKKTQQASLLSPILDSVFKMTWGSRKYIGNTKDLLKAGIDLPDDEIDSITLIDPFLQRIWKKDKLGIVDVKVLTKAGNVINVELQARKDSAMRKRILYYAAKLIWEQVKYGDSFDLINRTICVVICDHELLPVEEETDYKNRYFMANQKSGKLFTDLVEIITVELPKVPDTDNGDPLWPFLQFFKYREEEDFSMLAEKYGQVRGAFQALREVSMSPQARRLADARQKERWAQETREKDSYKEGGAAKQAEADAALARAETERARADAALARAETERAKAEAEQARADEERRLRLEAESRAQELERRIRELE
jgi:predicted transposase/invertase (TIGR01784 family)